MLLTQPQIATALSSFIILLFTSLLFLSGYILQQRTVESLQTAIRPRIQALKALPQAQYPQAQVPTVAVAFGDAGAAVRLSAQETRGDVLDDDAEEDVYEYLERPAVDWAVGEGDELGGWRGRDSEEDDGGLRGVEVDAAGKRTREETGGIEGSGTGSRRGKLRSLDDWAYSDESEGQKRMREGVGVLDRWTQS